jgi:hypothetical protein
LREAGLGPKTACVVTIIFMLNPTVILYEHLLYYTYMEGVLILLAAYCLSRWARGGCLSWAASFWLALGCLGGMRSLFHPVFFVCLSAVLCLYYIKIRQRRQALVFCAASLLALAPLGILCAKNDAVYGFWGNSSWDGISLWTKACGYGPDELKQLHRSGVISLLALDAGLEPFRGLDAYADGKKFMEISCHHPSDCAPFKSNGKPNYNHIGYLQISRQLWKDAVAIIWNDPSRFAFQTLGSYSLTLWYASDSVHALFKNNMEILEPLESAYRYLYFGFIGVQSRHSDPRIWLRIALVSLVFVIFYGATIVQVFCSRDSALAAVCLFCMLIHAYTIAVSSIVEFGENNRFRFPVDGIFLVLMAGNIMAFLPLLRSERKK